jgi:hypothetical protein
MGVKVLELTNLKITLNSSLYLNGNLQFKEKFINFANDNFIFFKIYIINGLWQVEKDQEELNT